MKRMLLMLVLLAALTGSAWASFQMSIGRKTVTTHGTAVALSTDSSTAQRLIITALKTNTGVIAVGNSSVLAAAGSEVGILLKPTDQPVVLEAVVPSSVYIDSGTDGDGVTYLIQR